MTKNKNKELSDEELVALSLADHEKFVLIVSRYKGQLFSYVNRLGKFSKEDIEDILQEVFLKVFQNLNSFKQDLKFSSWIYRITHNYVISYFRKQRARPFLINQEDSELIWQHFSSEIDLKEEMEGKILQEKVMNVLNSLKKKYRDVLILKYLEDKDYNEISDILKKPSGTIGTLINRAKKKFKAKF